MKSIHAETYNNGEVDRQQGHAVDTGKAWEKLYSRLHHDGLLEEASNTRHRSILRPWMAWAATLLLLISTGTLIYLGAISSGDTPSYTTINNDGDNTFIKVLDDGSIVYLAAHASMQMPSHFAVDHRTVSLQGEAFFDIEPNCAQPFIIQTEAATIYVLGTAFNIRSEDADFELFVEHGLVRVEMKEADQAFVEAKPGEMVKVDAGKLVKSSSGGYNASAWKINRMHFKDETLDNVLSVINRNYGSQLLIDGQELKNRRITVTFYNNTLTTIIELLCLSMNLDAEARADEAIMLKPKT